MGRRVAVEYGCDRCGEIWYEDFDLKEKKSAKEPKSLSIKLGNREVNYDTLCEGCETTCNNYIDNIAKDLKRKPGAKKKGPPDATPPSPPADGATSSSSSAGPASGA